MPLSLKITDAGKLAAFNAAANGLQVAIAEVGVGTARYSASVAATALQAEVVRVPVLSSVLVSASQRTLRFRVGGNTAIDPVGEIGLYLNNTAKTLFAVWSEPIGSGFIVGTKGTNTDLLINANVLLGDLPTGSVTVMQQEPVTGLVQPLGGFGGEGNFELTGAATLSGLKRYQNFILRSGSTLTVDRYLTVLCSGFALIENGATVNVLPAAPGGTAYIYSGANTFVLQGYYTGKNLGSPGGASSSGRSYPSELSDIGSGGCGGGVTKQDAVSSSANTGAAGDGGGHFEIQAAVGITLAGVITANGTSAANATGSGGTQSINGSGGGSGGHFKAATPGFFTIAATCNISANGGNGGNALQVGAGALALGGVPGSGGVVELIGPNLPTTIPATISVAAGVRGANSGTGSAGSSGGGGAFGGNTAVSNGGAAGADPGRIVALRILP